MDNLLVDLDKVLDDFEAEENSAPGSEKKPFDFMEFLEQENIQTFENADLYRQYENNIFTESVSDKDVSNIRYDFPYEPEQFDLSDADFAPSTNFKDTESYGSGSISQNIDTQPVLNNLKQINGDSRIENHQMNGNVTMDTNTTLASQGLYTVTQPKEKNINLKLNVSPWENVKKPVQADNSPGVKSSEMALQINGHLDFQNTVCVPQLSSIPSLSTINSSPEYNKYPVQCNTPQTPKDPIVNPLEAQLAQCGTSNVDRSLERNSSSAIVNKSDFETMQDIPKLQNLKFDIEMGCDVKREVDENHGPVSNITDSSQSLPSFHETVSQNGVNSSSSLPSGLKNETQSSNTCGVEKQLEDQKDVKTGQTVEHLRTSLIQKVGESTDFVNTTETNTFNGEFSKDDTGICVDKTLNEKGELGNQMKTPVGFGNIDDVEDETDVNAYLGEECEDIGITDKNSTVTDVNLSEKYNGYNQSNLSTEIPASMCFDTEHKTKEITEAKVNERTNFDEIDMDTSDVSSRTEMCVNTVKVSDINKDSSKLNVNRTQLENSDLEVLKVLPLNPGEIVVNSNPVVSDPNATLSPIANMSLDSGVASLNDNLEDNSTDKIEVDDLGLDKGARPKDSQNNVNRPKPLGFSDSDSASPFVIKPVVPPSAELTGGMTEAGQSMCQVVENMVVDSVASFSEESRQLMESSKSEGDIYETHSDMQPAETESSVNEHQDFMHPPDDAVTSRPTSFNPNDSSQPAVQKQKRPTSLNLPPPPTIIPSDESEMSEDDASPGADTGGSVGTSAEGNQDQNEADSDQVGVASAEGGAEALQPPSEHMHDEPPPPYRCTLGRVAPKWIPDAEAPICMSCESRFTFTKRRHHCRACGKVFCSTCCSMKNRLPYLKNQEARVCVLCHSELAMADRDVGWPSHPNNPNDYSSVGAQAQAASGAASNASPSVLVPVLKRDAGANRQSAPKQVMFSDGIRPGCDLTELDGSSEVTRMLPRRSRVQKRVERVGQGQRSPRSRRLRTVAERTTKCLIPEEGLPPLCSQQSETSGYTLQPNPDANNFMADVKEESKAPVIFAVNQNLYVSVKIVTLDCCVNHTVWCFTTRGMTSVGQEEIVIVLETLPDESTPPKDVFVYLNSVFEDASKGNTITELGHSIISQSFLGSRDHGGFLYIRASFQCVQKLPLPRPPFLFGILLQKWETPWAKVFPLRLLLRLGAEYRYYPCPLIGVRNRKPVFYEIGHTIMNLLADFRNFQYMLPTIKGVAIHMQDKVTRINFPRNRYGDLMKVVNNSNEHVMAVAASFSAEADSHLVCIQNDDGNYQTQAINIQSKPRKVTGASFVVFNGALKTSSGLSAKSSIVEDGMMIQISPDSMLALKQAIRDMHDYPINCGVIGAPKPDETVVVQWVDDDKNVNIGVKSPIDGMSMDGIESLYIHNATDYIGEKYILRWTEIFFIQNEERGSPKGDPADLSRIGETIATAGSIALTQHLEKLKAAYIDKIGLRVTLGADNVGYEAGAKGEKLPDTYMNDLDNELIPVIHGASQPDISIVLELIFELLE